MRQMAEFEVDTATDEALALLTREYDEEVSLKEQLKDAKVVREKVEGYLAVADQVREKHDRTVELCTNLQSIVIENEALALRNKAMSSSELEQVSQTSSSVEDMQTTIAATMQFMRAKKRLGNNVIRFSHLGKPWSSPSSASSS